MSQTIEAVYEDGVFKPLQPVHLPEGTTVEIEPPAIDVEEFIRQRLQAEGTSLAQIENALDKLRPLWESYASLTDEQRSILEEARFDQEHFFDRQLP